MSIKFTKRHATCRWHTRSLWGSSGNNPNGQRISIYQANIIPWILIWRLGRKIKFNFCVSWRVTSTSWTRRNRISKLTIISCAVTSSFRPKSTSPSTIWNLIGFYAIYIIINVMYGAVWWPCGWIWAWDSSLEPSWPKNDGSMKKFRFARPARPQRAKMCFFTT